MKKSLFFSFVFVLGVLIGFLLDSSITRIPKDILTASRIRRIEKEIKLYDHAQGKIPDRLDLSPLEKDQLEDGWGKPFLYLKDGNDQCVWRSLRKIYSHDSIDGIIEERFVLPPRNK